MAHYSDSDLDLPAKLGHYRNSPVADSPKMEALMNRWLLVTITMASRWSGWRDKIERQTISDVLCIFNVIFDVSTQTKF